MRNLSLASLLALALCACGAGAGDAADGASTPPAGSGTTTPPAGGGATTPPPGGGGGGTTPPPGGGGGGTTPPPPQPSQVPPAPPPLTQLPAWVAALQPGDWAQIPNTALSSVTPTPTPPGNGPQFKLQGWTSFVVDTRTSKVYSVAGGGHNDYAGNEVDELNLEVAQPSWTQKLAPTPNSQITNCGSYYGDGRPASRHSYYGVTLDIVNDRIMLFGGVPWCSAGGFHRAVSSYNIGANTFNGQGTHPDVPGTVDVAAYSIDPTTGDVYGVQFNVMRRWNRALNSWTTLNPSGATPQGTETMSAMDSSTRRRILFLGGIGNDHHVYTLSSNSVGPVSLTGADAATVTGADKGSLVYIPAFDRYLVRLGGAGATVYMIHPETWEVTQLATTGGGSIPSTVNGPYNKFLYVPRLGGAVYVPSYTGNAWFLRLH